ncbi:MAG: hypothetical protein AB1801_09815, partial [Chloroflexota bacterium]
LAGRRLVAHELTHTVQQGISTSIFNGSLSVRKTDSLEERQADHISRNIEHQVEIPSLKSQSRKDMACINRQAAPSAQEQQFWLELGKQPNYGVLSRNKRTPMASTTGNQQADEFLWTAEALIVRADKMRTFLQSHFGADKDLRVTSVVKPGEHTTYRKMDVARAGTSTWEELTAAAVHAGFWVHAEGIMLWGKFWPLSPNATGPHLDLYLIKTEAGDFPAPKDTSTETRYASSESTRESYEV